MTDSTTTANGKPKAKIGSRGHYSRSYYMANREKFRGWALSYNFRNIEKMLLYCAKSRAKKKGLPFNIDITDVIVPKMCPVFNIPIFRTAPVPGQVKRNCANAPSLDRIRPELGYVKGNVRVISWRANTLKKDGALEEFEAIVRDLRKLKLKDQ